MLNDLNRYFSYLLNNDEGKGTKNKIIFIIFLFLTLLIVNKFLLVKFADSENFQIHSALSNLLFIKGISPYSKDISSILVNFYSSRGAILKSYEMVFRLPIYQLFFYLPFSFISNQNWSLSLWLTLNQCIFLLCIQNCYKLFRWEPKKWLEITILTSGIVTFFGISNFFAANTSIIQLLFLILGLKAIFSEKYVIAGLLIGLATIDPFNFSIPLFIILSYLFFKKKYVPLFWFIISTALLSLVGLIFDSGWILKFLRNIFLERSFYPFIDYNHALFNWISKLSFGSLLNFVPILLLIWIFLEYYRLPKQNSNQLFWLLSLVCCINPFVIMRENNYSSVLYILPIIFIVYLWENHSAGLFNKVIYGIVGFTAVTLPLAVLLFPGIINFATNFHSVNLINSIVLILVLYWIRWWVVVPYDFLKTK